jgi:tetratricopeptide (TPR) repeat protein
VAPLEIEARLLAREGKAPEAIAKLHEAIEEEIKLGYSEPPLYPQPMPEVAGKVALELKRWVEAEEFFRAAIERDPGSGRALFGLLEAQRGAGKNDEARETYANFLKAWAQADTDLPELRRAKQWAADLRIPAEQPRSGQ